MKSEKTLDKERLKPKVALDKDLLKEAVNYYRYKFSEEDYVNTEEWECFSEPGLEQHDCNSRALLPGRHKCGCCNNTVGRPCDVSCDFQNFCLAVFGWRRGVGGEDFKEALRHNLYDLNAEELYNAVTMVMSCGEEALEVLDPPKPAKPVKPKSEPVKKESKPKVKIAKKIKVKKGKVEEGEQLYSLKEAAAIKGCTYSNLYVHAKRGKLPIVEVNNMKMVRKSVLDAFTIKRGKAK